MAKATSRKHATHHKKARAHHAVKTPARRSSVSKPSESGSTSVSEIRIESEVIDDEFSSRSVPRSLDDEEDAEVGIYGPGRGEDAG